jgi:NDP-sugar pyrophosphorylase family protein
VQALILTAGLGRRLDPLTRLVAKPAVPLGGATLIEHVLAWVRRQGIAEVVLNLHHRPASLTAIVGDGRHLGLRVRYSWEDPLLGSAGGPRHALSLLDSDPFLIVNGDTLCDFDLSPMLAAHAASGTDVTMAVVPNSDPDRYNGVAVDALDRVTGFVPKGADARGTRHFVGVQVAHARAFADLPDGQVLETVAGIYRDMVAETPGRICAWPAPTTFLDVGTPSDYLRAAETMGDQAARPTWPHTVIWPDAAVDRGADLTGCVVAGPIALPSGFRARDAVVVPASLVRAGDTAEVRGDVALFPF